MHPDHEMIPRQNVGAILLSILSYFFPRWSLLAHRVQPFATSVKRKSFAVTHYSGGLIHDDGTTSVFVHAHFCRFRWTGRAWCGPSNSTRVATRISNSESKAWPSSTTVTWQVRTDTNEIRARGSSHTCFFLVIATVKTNADFSAVWTTCLKSSHYE